MAYKIKKRKNNMVQQVKLEDVKDANLFTRTNGKIVMITTPSMTIFKAVPNKEVLKIQDRKSMTKNFSKIEDARDYLETLPD